jgi:hypothetical protein
MRRVVITIALVVFAVSKAQADMSEEELAKLAQNPVGNLISLPFQNNSNLNYGPLKKTQNILNIQPVIPFDISPEWNIITRTIVPVVSQPALFDGDSRTNGIGPTAFSAFLSPADPKGGVIWGAGPIIQIPTTSDSALGSHRWGFGPSFVMLHLAKGDPWVYGFLVNNVWSVGTGGGGAYNNFLLQPFINYNFKEHEGLYLTSAPIMTANWRADTSNKWTVPLGGGIGKIFHFGRLPVNSQISAYYNLIKPESGPNWQIRAQVQLMFPK